MAYRRVAQILWGGWKLYGFMAWIGMGAMSNFISFLIIPFAQALPLWLKILYGAGLFGAALLISVIIFRVLQACFKPQADSGLSQSVADSPVGGDIIQAQAGRDVNVYREPKPEELTAPLKIDKLFDVEYRTSTIGLPLNHLDDGTWRASSAIFSPSPIIIVHRGDLTKITRVTVAPEVRFIYEDGTGWETTPAITVTPQRPLPPSMRAPGATDFEWDVSNPSQWELTGLPLTMAKDELLELPAMGIGILDATLAGTHFEKRDKCTLTIRLTIRTDKGSPIIPDLSIELTASDIKNTMDLFKPKEKETNESSG